MSEERTEFSKLVDEIVADWKTPYFGAVPYIRAMQTMTSAKDAYGAETPGYVVTYFLGNAATWRGETARRVKARLKEMLKQ